MPKFSFKFFKTKTGHTTLWVIGGLVVFYIAYRYISGIGSGSNVSVANTGPTDAQVQAEAAQNLAQIQANAGISAATIQADAQTQQAILAAQVANNQIQEQGNEAAIAGGVANNTITAQLQGLIDSNKTAIANTTIASNTVLAEVKQQNDLLLGEMNIQSAEFTKQVDANVIGQTLALEAQVTTKSSKSVKNTLPVYAASVSAFLNGVGGSSSPTTLH